MIILTRWTIQGPASGWELVVTVNFFPFPNDSLRSLCSGSTRGGPRQAALPAACLSFRCSRQRWDFPGRWDPFTPLIYSYANAWRSWILSLVFLAVRDWKYERRSPTRSCPSSSWRLKKWVSSGAREKGLWPRCLAFAAIVQSVAVRHVIDTFFLRLYFSI